MSVSMRNPPQRRRSLGPVSPKRIYRNLSVRLRGGESSVGGETDTPKHLGKTADAVRYLGVILRGSLVIVTEIMRFFFGITCWLLYPRLDCLSDLYVLHYRLVPSLYLIKYISLLVWTLFLFVFLPNLPPPLALHPLPCSPLVQDPVGGSGKWGHFGSTKPAIQRPHQLWRRNRRRRRSKHVGERREEREGLGEREGKRGEQGEWTGSSPPGCGCPYPQLPSAPCVDKGGSQA